MTTTKDREIMKNNDVGELSKQGGTRRINSRDQFRSPKAQDISSGSTGTDEGGEGGTSGNWGGGATKDSDHRGSPKK